MRTHTRWSSCRPRSSAGSPRSAHASPARSPPSPRWSDSPPTDTNNTAPGSDRVAHWLQASAVAIVALFWLEILAHFLLVLLLAACMHSLSTVLRTFTCEYSPSAAFLITSKRTVMLAYITWEELNDIRKNTERRSVYTARFISARWERARFGWVNTCRIQFFCNVHIQ